MERDSAGAQLVTELGERLWLLLAAPPGGGVVGQDLDCCRTDLLGPAGGLEQAGRERQMRADQARSTGGSDRMARVPDSESRNTVRRSSN